MKKNKQFTVLAEYYDCFNGADYAGYADYVERAFKTHVEATIEKSGL